MQIKGNNIIIETLDINNLPDYQNMIKTSLFEDKDLVLKLSVTEPKAYFYQITKNDEIIGTIGYDVISMINEFKLAKLHLAISNLDYLNEALSLLLSHAILNNFVVKMVCHTNDENILKRLKMNKFIFEKNINELVEYKITKPLYLAR